MCFLGTPRRYRSAAGPRCCIPVYDMRSRPPPHLNSDVLREKKCVKTKKRKTSAAKGKKATERCPGQPRRQDNPMLRHVATKADHPRSDDTMANNTSRLVSRLLLPTLPPPPTRPCQPRPAYPRLHRFLFPITTPPRARAIRAYACATTYCPTGTGGNEK